jgi:predicted transcriptional regulator
LAQTALFGSINVFIRNFRGKRKFKYLVSIVIGIATLYYSEKRWYEGQKRPVLQIKILKNIALRGELSKAKARDLLQGCHHYPEIFQAFRSLEKNGLIKFSRNDAGRGKKETYYKITEKGIISLVIEEPEPELFWNALMQYCQLSKNSLGKHVRVDLKQIDYFYRFFIKKYLKYSSSADYIYYLSQIDDFNKACEYLLRDSAVLATSAGVNDNNDNNIQEKISIVQKVVESLALRPGMNVRELAKEIGETIEAVEKDIVQYTYAPVSRQIIDQEFVVRYHNSPPSDRKKIDESITKEQWQLILHSIIQKKNRTHDDNVLSGTYELSLFGVMLALAIVRLNDAGKLQSGLFHWQISLPDYYDRIALNYENKLPLIFRKWNVLKRILKVFSAYNFDIIIDKETRSKAMNNSILSGGSGEFFKSAEAVVHHSHSLLGRVQLAGLNTYHNYLSNLNLRRRRSRQWHNDHNYDDEDHNNNNNNTTLKKENKEDDNAAISIYHKLREISLQLDFVDLGFAQQEFSKYADTEPQKVKELLGLSQIQILEEAFAKEITLLYYFALNNATDFAFSQPMKHLSLMYSEAEKEYFSAISKPKNPRPKDRDDNFDPYAILPGSIIPLSPRRRLHAILRQDKEIQEWFSSWITDLARYNEEIVEKMATTRNETQLKK